jgi:uncharacterized membrane protein HdeD (DUF308 family)
MVGQLIRNWWMPVVRGALGILFGLLVFAYPQTAVTVFVYLFGAYMLLDGIVALTMAFDVSRGRGWLILSGIAGIAAGILTFLYPSTTALALVYIVAAWAILSGIFEVIAALEWREVLGDAWMLGLAGVLSIIVGVLLVSSPSAGLLAWAWLIGIYAIGYGVLYIVAGLRIKNLQPSQSGSTIHK